ncbi:MAG: hypothetical protein WBX19_21925 [Terracidiphilus sp.]
MRKTKRLLVRAHFGAVAPRWKLRVEVDRVVHHLGAGDCRSTVRQSILNTADSIEQARYRHGPVKPELIKQGEPDKFIIEMYRRR